MPTVVVQKWEESERGWGTRPDGYSLHLNDADREAYIKAYWDHMPNTAPAEYSRPDATPYVADVEETVYRAVAKARTEGKCGVRFYENVYPGSGGPDGWRVSKEKG